MAKEEKKGPSGVAMVEVPASGASLLTKFGAKYSIEPSKVFDTLCKTAFADATSMEQVVALLVVADQYGLNPFTKEIFAFPDKKGGVVPIVGVDGWNRIAQQRKEFDGVEFIYADEMVTQDEDAKPCPEWIEVIVHRKDRSHPTHIREYLDECYRPLGTYPDGNKHKDGHWQTHTKRALRHKALIQGYRTAFGFHGIYDPDEAEGFIDIEGRTMTPTPSEPKRVNPSLASDLTRSTEKAVSAEAAEEGEQGDGGEATPPGIAQGPARGDDLGL